MKATGIYLGGSGVEAVEVAGSRRSPRLSRCARAAFAPGGDRGAALSEALRSCGLRPARAFVAISGETAMLRRITVPLKNPAALSRAVGFQAEELLCDASLEDVVIEHQVLGQTDGGTEVMVIVARKSEIARALADAKTAGFEPGCVTVDAAALFAAAAASGALPNRGLAAVLDVEGALTRILLVRDGKAWAFRCARRAEDDEAAGAAAAELARTLAAEGHAGPVERVLAFGDFAAEVSAAAGARLAADHAAPAPGFEACIGKPVSAIAAGAGLMASGIAPLQVNFLKGEFAPAIDARRLRSRLAFAAACLVVLFAVLLASSWRRWSSAHAYLDSLTREEQKIWKSVFPNKTFPRVGFDRYLMDSKIRDSRRAVEEPRYFSFLDALTRSAQAFPGEGVDVQAMTFDQQKMVISGEVDSMERFDSLVSSLESRFGVRVKPQMEKRGRPGRDRRTTFKIEIPRRKEGA